jgi:hypothetical protein
MYCSLEVSCVVCPKAERQGCRKKSEKEWAATALVSVQTRSLVSLLRAQNESGVKVLEVWWVMFCKSSLQRVFKQKIVPVINND